MGGKRLGKVHTIGLPWRENLREYDIHDSGHFGSKYGELLWRKESAIPITKPRSEGAFLRWEEGSIYNTFLGRHNHTGIRRWHACITPSQVLQDKGVRHGLKDQVVGHARWHDRSPLGLCDIHPDSAAWRERMCELQQLSGNQVKQSWAKHTGDKRTVSVPAGCVDISLNCA